MYGFIYSTLRNMVIEKHGEEAWRKICESGGVMEMDGGILDRQYYDEAFLTKIGVPLEKILEDFGGFFFKTIKRSGHSSLLRTLGHNLYGFLMNLDTLHDHLSFTYPEMRAPSFRCVKTRTGLILHYYSERKGLVSIVLGIVRAVAREFYRLEHLQISLTGYEEEEHLRHKHHYTVKIEATGGSKNLERLRGEHSLEQQQQLLLPIVDSDRELSFDEASFSRLLQYPTITNRSCSTGQVIAEETDGQGQEPCGRSSPNLPEPSGASVSQQHSSSSLLQMPCPILPALSFSSFPSRRNSAMFIETDWPISPQLFQTCFPFHVIFDHELVVRHMGVSLQRLFPHAINEAHLSDLFDLLRPTIQLSYAIIRNSINSLFTVATRNSPTLAESRVVQEPLQFRGQMVPTSQRENCPVLFLASPRISSIEELEQRGLYLSDIPMHDVTRDLILLNRHFRVEMRIAQELEQTKRDLEMQKAQVQEEKARADRLLHAMLPCSVAQELKDNAEASAIEYTSVSILFGDIKDFTVICNRCSPMQVVGMLNELYTLFDSLLEKHQVYKVETIGDSYMVAAGLLDTSTQHAEALTNMAFDMRQHASQVLQPSTREELQIRIGIHSGPVVTGVVGKKMPRYCLFGDTVNTASRMESHGEPGRVHISEATYQLLAGQPFTFFSRGCITIKGLGEKQTYFVEPECDDAFALMEEEEWNTGSPTESFVRSPSFVKYHRIVPVTSFTPPLQDRPQLSLDVTPSQDSLGVYDGPDDPLMIRSCMKEGSSPADNTQVRATMSVFVSSNSHEAEGHTHKQGKGPTHKHGRHKHKKDKCHVS